MSARRPSAGFTLVETGIVLMIIVLVLSIAVPSYRGYIERARVVEGIAGLGEMSRRIKRFEVAKGRLPDDLGEPGVDYGGKLDPWGRPYEYVNLLTAKGNGQARQDKKLKPLNSDFDLYSVGPDGVTAASLSNSKSRDDLVRARDGGFIGTAEEFDP